MPQSHDNQHELVDLLVAAFRSAPKGRSARDRKGRREAAKEATGALRWHLRSTFHTHEAVRLPPTATLQELEAEHARLHPEGSS